jgi:hypothetical protein
VFGDRGDDVVSGGMRPSDDGANHGKALGGDLESVLTEHVVGCR